MLRTAASRLAGAVRPLRSSGSVASARTLVTAKLPDLGYDFGALEPVISGEIMALHHAKHHNAYVTNFNIAMEKYAEAEETGDYAAMIALQGAIKFNGGGALCGQRKEKYI
jgi:Fe-Mn family superoxide dismutase